MAKIESAERAFAIAKEIDILMGELMEAVVELGKDDSISTQHRHLAIKQITEFYSERETAVRKFAGEYLDEQVVKEANVKVPGFSLGENDETYVSGMVYNYKPQHKIEILNKDDDEAWAALVIALAKAGFAKAIQKRISVSYFLGPTGEAALEAAAGLINCSTDGTWSITKPKPLKK